VCLLLDIVYLFKSRFGTLVANVIILISQVAVCQPVLIDWLTGWLAG